MRLRAINMGFVAAATLVVGMLVAFAVLSPQRTTNGSQSERAEIVTPKIDVPERVLAHSPYPS